MAHSTFLSIALILPILAADIPGSFVIKKIEGLRTFIARYPTCNYYKGFASKVGLFADFWGKRHFCPKNHFDVFLTNRKRTASMRCLLAERTVTSTPGISALDEHNSHTTGCLIVLLQKQTLYAVSQLQ